MREFATAAGRVALTNDRDIEFMLDDRKVTAHPPTTGQLALFLRADVAARAVPTMLAFLADVLDDADWRWIERRLHDGIDITVLADITNFLIGEWSGRPTKPASDSSDTPSTTGRKSTDKQPEKVEALTS